MSLQNEFLSIVSIYRICPDVFDDMVLPSYTDDSGTVHTLDREDTIFDIFTKCSELELLYSDGDFLKEAIKRWSRKHLNGWNKAYRVLYISYNPIWNKDGTIREHSVETRDLSNSSEYSGTDTRAENGTNRTDFGSTNENTVAAFNSSSYSPQNKSQNGGADTSTLSNHSSTTYGQKVDGSDTGTVSHDYERTEQGNIGMTSTQDLVRQEMEISEYSIIDIISDSFKRELCLSIY